MKKKKRSLKDIIAGLTFRVIGSTIILLFVFALIIEIITYNYFSSTLTKEYNDSAYRTAVTATALVNPDNFDNYLTSRGSDLEYKTSLDRLDILCNKQNVTLIYIIAVDTSDYKSFTNVFNSVLDGSGYTRWDIGYRRDTTNDEYVNAYRNLYEKKTDRETIVRVKNLNGREAHITSLIPVKNSKGDVVAILCVERPMSELTVIRESYLVWVSLTTLGLALFTSIMAFLFLKKYVVKPIVNISSETNRFAKENVLTKDKLPEMKSKITEIKSLAKSINKMEEDMISYVDNLTKVTKEQERIGTELTLASEIQESSIPVDFIDRDEFNLYGSMIPAKEVGGDFYNYFWIDDNHIALVMADVSGKGIPAALFMMASTILINNRTLMGGKPSEILEFVNNRLCENNKVDMFVSVWLGILDVKKGTIIAANGGHEYPVIYHSNDGFDILQDKHGLVLGTMENIKYTDYEIKLNDGDKIFLYTDGLPEANNSDSKMFGIDNVLRSLNKMTDSNAKDVILGMQNSVNKFVNGADQFDDLTMLCLEYKKANKDLFKKEKEFIAKKDELSSVLEFFKDCLIQSGCKLKDELKMEVVIEELFINIVSYAYKDKIGNVNIEISVDKKNRDVRIVVKDKGIPFNPLEKADPDITLSAEERKIGGLGIYMTKQIVDDMQYEYKDKSNVVILIKKF